MALRAELYVSLTNKLTSDDDCVSKLVVSVRIKDVSILSRDSRLSDGAG